MHSPLLTLNGNVWHKYSMVARGRRIREILTLVGKPFVAIDYNSTLVLRERADGHATFYGDARRPDVLRAVGVADASLVLVTLDDFEATEDIVAAVHTTYPDVTILARGEDANQCRMLRQLGAALAVSENLEASLELAREALSSWFCFYISTSCRGARGSLRLIGRNHLTN